MFSARFFRFFRYLTLNTLKQIIERMNQERLPGLAAEMAYNTMLALFPGILAVLTAIGLFDFSRTTFQGLASRLSEVAPPDALSLIRNFADEISLSRNQGLFSLSFIAAIWAASGAVSAAMTALDEIGRIPNEKRRPFWKAKLISIVLTLGTIVLLFVASFLVFISDWLVRFAAGQSGALESGVLGLWRLLSWPVALGIVVAASAFIYRFGPSRWRRGTPILPGALMAAVSWALISGLFRLYVSHFGNYNKAYGAVGAVIVLLLWLYLTSLIMLLGNQVNVTVGEVMFQQRSRALALAEEESAETPPGDRPMREP